MRLKRSFRVILDFTDSELDSLWNFNFNRVDNRVFFYWARTCSSALLALYGLDAGCLVFFSLFFSSSPTRSVGIPFDADCVADRFFLARIDYALSYSVPINSAAMQLFSYCCFVLIDRLIAGGPAPTGNPVENPVTPV